MLACAEDWGVEDGDIDEELADARERTAKLRKNGRHSKILQRKIQDFERLLELRGLVVAKNVSDTNPPTEELQSEFDELLTPYAEESGMSEKDIEKELSDARERMAKLSVKIKDLERLAELRDQLLARQKFATNEQKENLGSEFDHLSRAYTATLGTDAERKEGHASVEDTSVVVTEHHASAVAGSDSHRDHTNRAGTADRGVPTDINPEFVEPKCCCTLM